MKHQLPYEITPCHPTQTNISRLIRSQADQYLIHLSQVNRPRDSVKYHCSLVNKQNEFLAEQNKRQKQQTVKNTGGWIGLTEVHAA